MTWGWVNDDSACGTLSVTTGTNLNSCMSVVCFSFIYFIKASNVDTVDTARQCVSMCTMFQNCSFEV